MPDILVLGAGLNGLTTALLLARDGHRVTVLERDPAEPAAGGAEELWRDWERPGVKQFRLVHLMLPRWRAEMDRELPEVIAELEALGGLRVNLVRELPDALTGGVCEGDERFETVTGRRPVVEAALTAVAARIPGVTVHRGVTVTGLVVAEASAPGVPHVDGVTVEGGRTFLAELVVDAGGRRSTVADMVATAGGRRPVEEREDSGFVYYTRHFSSRGTGGGVPASQDVLLQSFDSLSVLTLACDNDTWGVGLIVSSRDRRLRALREAGAWGRALASYPTAARWGEAEPITPVQAIAGIEDRHRRYVVDGAPTVIGLVAVGDSWACTNPSLGRGSSIGVLHACALRDLLRETDPAKPDDLVLHFDEATETGAAGGFFRATLAFDRHRLAELNADMNGVRYETDDPGWAFTKALQAVALRDPDALRARSLIGSLLETPDAALARPGVMDKVIELGADAPQYPAPGPDRAGLLAAIGEGT
ncbi:FAD-dependent oxidoreductase [Streptomyces sp. NPDC102340]|uniref:FAD-dependent oxidoreductase n=1 Tax=unclassified Streptomyces TaxID=2593676 RepID=UPI00382FD206